MNIRTSKLAFVIALMTTTLGLMLLYGWRQTSDFSRLRAKYSVEAASIGIPRISRMYDARLLNTGMMPVRIQVCTFVDDVNDKGEAVPYRVQQVNKRTGQWQTVADASGIRSCRPYPLGWFSHTLN